MVATVYGATTALIPSPSTAHIRMDSVNRESMEGHFNLLEDTLKEHDLMNRPAQIYNMDESTTLKDRLSGRVAHGTKPGLVKYLNDEEECALSDHLIKAAKAGYGKTRGQVKVIVENVAREKKLLRSD